jgi:hypothetical protein
LCSDDTGEFYFDNAAADADESDNCTRVMSASLRGVVKRYVARHRRVMRSIGDANLSTQAYRFVVFAEWPEVCRKTSRMRM